MSKKSVKKVESKSRVAVLKVNIQKTWIADDFAMAFDAFNKVYLFNEALEGAYSKITDGDFPEDRGDRKTQIERLIQQINRTLTTQCYSVFGHYNSRFGERIIHLGTFTPSALLVKRINFNSPGSIDFVGFGKALEVIRDWFNRYIPTEGEKLDNELKRQKIEDAKLDRAQKKIAMMRELGMAPEDITALVGLEALHLNRLDQLGKSGHITGVEIVDE